MNRRAMLAAMMLLASPSRADDAQTCARAYEHGQELRVAHKLAEARDEFLVCARPTCPKVAREDCSKWLGEAEASLPAMTVNATRGGAAFDDARVLVDGTVVAERIDARAITLDVGKHVVRVEPRGCAAHEQEVSLASAQHASVSFDVCAEVKPVVPVVVTKHPPVATFVASAVGVAALGSFIVLGAIGVADANHLRDTCYPYCETSDVNRANAELAAADVSLGITIACVAVAAIWWLVAPRTTTHTALAPMRWTF